MSSRVLRRLQGKDNLIEKFGDNEASDNESNLADCGGARRKALPVNPYDLLNQESQSESEVKEDDNDEEVADVENTSQEDSRQRKKKKKKKKKKYVRTADANNKSSEENTGFDPDFENLNTPEKEKTDIVLDQSVRQRPATKHEESRKNGCPAALSIKLKNLNATNELKRIFGSSIVQNDYSRRRGRGRALTKTLWLVNPKENWPPIGKTGLSMTVDRLDGAHMFNYEHNPQYQQVQIRFLAAVNSLNPDNIVGIINNHPYHVDALIQLSDLCKVSEDLQMAADLNERAMYCLESAFHPLFNMARGNCRLDYRRQENRAFYICLFKHLTFVGQRACYLTALELCKLLLSLEFDSDPLAVVLCIDFYALRSRNYAWLITAAEEWEATKNLTQLPNFAFSIALAHFHLTQSDLSKADKLLQDALILFPGVLTLLLDKCSIQIDYRVSSHPFFTSEAELGQTQALSRLVSLYVHRTYHEWKTPDILPWLEKNVHKVLDRVDAGDPYVKECMKRRETRYPQTPRNVLRHILLSDIKEVTATVSGDIDTPIWSFDPLPPLDSQNLYTRPESMRLYEHSTAFSAFFRSLLPNYNMQPILPPNIQNLPLIGELAEEAQGAAGLAANLGMPGAAALGDSLRDSVAVLMDAIGAVLANIPMRDDDDDDDDEDVDDDLGPDSDDEGEGELDSEPLPDTDSNSRPGSS